jgi:hypothetical protein
MQKPDSDLHPFVKGLVFIIAGAFALYGIWATIIAFVGGVLPIVGIRLPGGLISGILWMVIADPILMTVGYWIGMIVVIPIQMLITWLRQ